MGFIGERFRIQDTHLEPIRIVDLKQEIKVVSGREILPTVGSARRPL